jgi:peroxiredoxin-like protein
METHYYEVDLSWTNDRRGVLSSEVLSNTIAVATPPEFKGGMPNIWSPEHLLVAAVNSCLMTTFLAIAENFKLEYESFDCKAVGKLEIVDGKYMISEIELQPHVSVAKEENIDKALKVLSKAEKACLISNSVKSTVIMKPMVTLTVGSINYDNNKYLSS